MMDDNTALYVLLGALFIIVIANYQINGHDLKESITHTILDLDKSLIGYLDYMDEQHIRLTLANFMESIVILAHLVTYGALIHLTMKYFNAGFFMALFYVAVLLFGLHIIGMIVDDEPVNLDSISGTIPFSGISKLVFNFGDLKDGDFSQPLVSTKNLTDIYKITGENDNITMDLTMETVTNETNLTMEI